jgi:glutamate carboxypeptidase
MQISFRRRNARTRRRFDLDPDAAYGEGAGMRYILLLALIAFALPAEAHLTREEQAMTANVDREADRTIALLERMVNRNSGTLNLAGVAAVGEMVRAELAPLGFEVRWADMLETGRAGHIVATHRGNGRGKRILLIGHLDTVFEPDSPFQAFARAGNRATGPGVGDCKGGDVVLIAALRAMQAAGTLRDADIMVVMTGDEERPGTPLSLARRDLIEAGRWADVALEFENLAVENGRDFGTVARRSATSWTLTAHGRSGHSSGVFGDELGYGAIYEMARILDGFRRELAEPNLTYNVGVIGGGTPATIDADGFRIAASGKTNITAATAIARGDIRALTPEQEARVRSRMQAIVAQHLPRTEAELTFSEDGYPPMAPTAGNRALLARLNGVNRDLGLPEMPEYDPAKRGAADSSFVAGDADTLAGMGAAGGNAHATGEWIALDSLTRQAKRTAILMTRLSREPRQAR